jgi:hypothetical protein
MYSTYFELDFVNPATPGEHNHDTYDLIFERVGELTQELHNPFMEMCEWFDYEDVMCFVSQEFPELMIIISGDGEDSDDLWREAWQDGKVVARWDVSPAPNNEDLITKFAV